MPAVNASASEGDDIHKVPAKSWQRKPIDFSDCLRVVEEFEQDTQKFKDPQYEFVAEEVDPHFPRELTAVRLPLRWNIGA